MEKMDMLFEQDWPRFRPTVMKLLHQENVVHSDWQDLFCKVHNLCQWDENSSPKIEKALHIDIMDYIRQAHQRVMQHEEDSALLKAYISEWQKFFTQCQYLPLPFKSLETDLKAKRKKDQPTNPSDKGESLIKKMMLQSWNTTIFCNIRCRLQDSAMKLVQMERSGEAFDTQLVIGVRESFVNLGASNTDRLSIYTENFEKSYTEATVKFYTVKAAEYLATHGVMEYMMFADKKLHAEEEMAKKYLEVRDGCLSVAKLIDCCVQVLVLNFKDTILAECAGLIRANDTSKLSLMFRLMDRVDDGVVPMLQDLQSHIKEAGLFDMLANAEAITTDSERYVEQLLSLFTRFTDLVSNAFQSDARFLTARDMAYKSLVNDTSVFKLDFMPRFKGGAKNQPESKCPELLANYCDMLLRKTPLSKKLAAEEVEAKLKNLLLVLKYVQNKDVFMRLHQAHLTRRLILELSADNEVEEFMVVWLREIGMPAEYVNKLARMFQDIKVSNDLNESFKEMVRNNNGIASSSAEVVNIKILNSGAWSRASERVAVSLPSELEDVIPCIDEFYSKKHNGRKLQWNNLMSNAVISFVTESGKYDLEVTTFQMAVLFCWNDRVGEELSFESLQLATQLPDVELRRTLWSLVALPKLRRQVLSYHPEVTGLKDLVDTTHFRVNQQFALIKNGKIQKRGKVNMIGRLQLSTERSSEEDSEAILRLRMLRVQEAIVKIMKMRKSLNNAALQTELIDMLKNMFHPSKKLIKGQIEWLIENKYIRRDSSDINRFIYMA